MSVFPWLVVSLLSFLLLVCLGDSVAGDSPQTDFHQVPVPAGLLAGPASRSRREPASWKDQRSIAMGSFTSVT